MIIAICAVSLVVSGTTVKISDGVKYSNGTLYTVAIKITITKISHNVKYSYSILYTIVIRITKNKISHHVKICMAKCTATLAAKSTKLATA